MNKAAVSPDVRDDVDEIKFLTGDQLFGVIIGAGDAVSLGKLFCFRKRAVVDCDALDSWQFKPRGQLIVRPETGAKNGESQSFHFKKKSTLSRVMTNVTVL